MTAKLLLVTVLFTGLGFSGSAVAATRQGGPGYRPPSGKRAQVFRTVSHVAVSNQWKSVLNIRSDSPDPIFLLLEFYNENGEPVRATLYDSDGFEYIDAAGFELDLAGYEIYSLEFDQLEGSWRSLQIFVFSDETESAYGLEAIYNNFSGQDKVSAVGVAVQTPGDLFVMNLDQRLDAYTGNRKFRGMAITNVGLEDCDCQATLFNDLGESEDLGGTPYPNILLNIPGSGKWVGTVYDLYPGIDNLLPNGLGYFEIGCTNFVSVLGLGFEAGSPVVASVPIQYFTAGKRKGGVVRMRRDEVGLPAAMRR